MEVGRRAVAGVLAWLLWVIKLAHTLSTPASLDTLSKFSFDVSNRFLVLTVPAPKNETSIFGLFEAAESSVVFELRIGDDASILNLPAEDVHLSARNMTNLCANTEGSTELRIELELEPNAITVRTRNSERYPLQHLMIPQEHFRLLFFAIPSASLCIVPATWSKGNQSHLVRSDTQTTARLQWLSTLTLAPITKSSTKRSRFNYKATTLSPLGRTAMMRTAYRRLMTTTRSPNVRFATYKSITTVSRPTLAPEEISYIDILKDRKTYEEVQRSPTREINSVWSWTFLFFFGIEVVLVSGFIMFGLSMFVLLQCRPSHEPYQKPLSP